jgi:hypothetical protein
LDAACAFQVTPAKIECRREEQRNKLEQMASLEKRSVSNLIEVMADQRWERLVEQQGVAYAGKSNY